MNKLYIVITVQIILLIVFIYIDYHLYKTVYPISNSIKDYKILKWCYLEDIYNQIHTGDLLLFSAYEFSKYTRIFGHLDFSHIGIVFQKENSNKLYSIEMIEDDYVYPGHNRYKNINHFDLIKRIINYPGYVYIAKFSSKITNVQYNKLKEIINIDFMYPSLLENSKLLLEKENILCDIENKACKKKFEKIHCSNLIAMILFNLNIYKFDNIKPINYHAQIIELCDGILFYEPVRIISEKNITDNIYNNKIKYYC